MGHENETWWHHRGIRPSDNAIREAVQLFNEGWTYKELGKKFNRSSSNMWVWINKFAKDLNNPDMNKKIRKSKGAERARRLVGFAAPETTASALTESRTESPEEKIRRLERELAEARMARDFYNEMINVAEKQFNINIRKKAGTRQ